MQLRRQRVTSAIPSRYFGRASLILPVIVPERDKTVWFGQIYFREHVEVANRIVLGPVIFAVAPARELSVESNQIGGDRACVTRSSFARISPRSEA